MDLPGYWIDRLPVGNRAYAAFIEDGGYDDPRWWTPEGWRWRQESRAFAPLFWTRDGGAWWRTRFGRTEPVPMDEPVQHVCWYEADAYARWAGKRLPTEAEWEKACGWDPEAERARQYPWGDDAPGPTGPTSGTGRHGPRRSAPSPPGPAPTASSR